MCAFTRGSETTIKFICGFKQRLGLMLALTSLIRLRKALLHIRRGRWVPAAAGSGRRPWPAQFGWSWIFPNLSKALLALGLAFSELRPAKPVQVLSRAFQRAPSTPRLFAPKCHADSLQASAPKMAWNIDSRSIVLLVSCSAILCRSALTLFQAEMTHNVWSEIHLNQYR